MAVALVTGSSSGIGKLSALELSRRGHRVCASMRKRRGVESDWDSPLGDHASTSEDAASQFGRRQWRRARASP